MYGVWVCSTERTTLILPPLLPLLQVDNFNADAVGQLMCRNYVSVKWDGKIYDCDFNQQVELEPKKRGFGGITVFDIECTDDLLDVPIATGHHCYGCTAGAGSS